MQEIYFFLLHLHDKIFSRKQTSFVDYQPCTNQKFQKEIKYIENFYTIKL